MSTFKVAGVSKLNGKFKVRFANDMLRVKVLEKNGHKDVDLVEFLSPLTKEQAVAKLIEMDFAKGNAEIQAALDEAQTKREPKAPKAKTVKVAKAKTVKAKAKPTMDAIKAKARAATKTKATDPAVAVDVANMEDTPF
jgi:hypothetical protein